MNVGSIIKLHRIQQNLTQEELADGIISTSYLSKIENGKIEPHEDVIKLLSARLGIDLTSQADANIKKKCEDWFHLLLTSKDTDLIKKTYEEIFPIAENMQDMELSVLWKIHLVRYYLKIEAYDLAKQQIDKLREISSTFNPIQKYYWLKFNGNYYSMINQQQNALQYYTLADNISIQTNISEEEKADLSYTLSVTCSKLRLTSEAQNYAAKALEYYKQNYHFERCAECHIILGISSRRIRQYDKAIQNYQLAQKLAELTKRKDLIRLVHQNLGHLHSVQNNREEAISHYAEIIKEETSHFEVRLLALISIIEEYYKSSHYEKALGKVMQGLGWLDKIGKDNYLIFYYELTVYKFLLNEEYEEFEKTLLDFIPILKQQKDYARLTTYTEMLGDFYVENHKYKLATIYFKVAIESYNKIIEI
ncbi:transcriptional regulator [Weizmannia acidilactici]|uniref:Transcriptional regulator n=1 Tax=Weizmannia acidilactici TaxID=2607726 RepID=A0A5J4JJM9_9BACI|nr:helix-turn-helix transcriptional regulator [Weizmannia acidilactici]GER68007.1 transcriptional regulator [Weizmannia acidilactici]GER70698.1 transcriptional regulator [Weizmannia acidilactici]GER74191.1 transcriptional regulator [Weizmannia acidilactici]